MDTRKGFWGAFGVGKMFFVSVLLQRQNIWAKLCCTTGLCIQSFETMGTVVALRVSWVDVCIASLVLSLLFPPYPTMRANTIPHPSLVVALAPYPLRLRMSTPATRFASLPVCALLFCSLVPSKYLGKKLVVRCDSEVVEGAESPLFRVEHCGQVRFFFFWFLRNIR